MARSELPKHRQIFESLRDSIQTGRYGPGDRLPSESELGKLFGVSRITLNRALRDLQTAAFIERRAGSGSYVKRKLTEGSTFGLLIPQLGQTEIFEPICAGMTRSTSTENVLIWGRSLHDETELDEHAWELCQQLIAKRVTGVFFAPLELTPRRMEVNRRIAAALQAAKIPLVLLDRDLEPYPGRSQFDLIGIDNRQIGRAHV